MSAIRRALAIAKEQRQGGDDGFSLMETIVAASIFAIFMSTAMAAIISMLTSTQKSQSLTDGSTQIENAFQKLDHQIRYADAINAPNPTPIAGNYYVEWHSQATSTAPPMCTQLRFNTATHVLQERSWSPTATPVAPTAWLQLAKNIVNNVTTAVPLQLPFVYTGTKANALSHQQLGLLLVAQPNGSRTSTSTVTTTTASFTALNSTIQSGLVCQEVARS